MAWYFYVGEKVTAIPRGDGVSVAVRPYTKVEIVGDSPKLRALRRKRLLRRTGPPLVKPNVGEPKGEIVPPEPTKFSRSVEELGSTKAPGSFAPPKSVVNEDQSKAGHRKIEKPKRRRRKPNTEGSDTKEESFGSKSEGTTDEAATTSEE